MCHIGNPQLVTKNKAPAKARFAARGVPISPVRAEGNGASAPLPRVEGGVEGGGPGRRNLGRKHRRSRPDRTRPGDRRPPPGPGLEEEPEAAGRRGCHSVRPSPTELVTRKRNGRGRVGRVGEATCLRGVTCPRVPWDFPPPALEVGELSEEGQKKKEEVGRGSRLVGGVTPRAPRRGARGAGGRADPGTRRSPRARRPPAAPGRGGVGREGAGGGVTRSTCGWASACGAVRRTSSLTATSTGPR